MPEKTTQMLPEGFNGTFYFTNYTDTDFEDYWNSVKYTFPAHSTVPLIIPSESPLGVQEIRKKFAKNLATLVLYRTDKYKVEESQTPGGQGFVPGSARAITDSDLAPWIQRCLEPLPQSNAKMEQVELDNTEKRLRKDESGRRRTKILKGDENLAPEGSVVA